MKHQLTAPAMKQTVSQVPIVKIKPWVVVKSSRSRNKLVYPTVLIPETDQGYIKAKRFDFL